MKLTDELMKDLKDRKVSLYDLEDEYLFDTGTANVENLLILLSNNICSFKEIVDTYSSIEEDDNGLCLKYLLNNKLIEEALKHNLMTNENLCYLLNKVAHVGCEITFDWLLDNTPLIKYMLNELVFDSEIVDKFNEMLKTWNWPSKPTEATIFDYLKYRNKNNEDILKLLGSYERIHKMLLILDIGEKRTKELLEILRHNEAAQKSLIQIVENNLQERYTYSQLKSLLSEATNKKKNEHKL